MLFAAVTAAVILAGTAMSEDLPPGVLLLSRVKNRVREELRQLPNISCVETVRRARQAPKGTMQPLDTIRLEVLTNGKKELYASPGGPKFSDAHPISFAGSGVLCNGIFGLYMKEILTNANVSNEYKGEEEIGGRRLARFDYREPWRSSGQTIETLEGSGIVGLHGSYWVDPVSYDMARLELIADDIPPTLPIAGWMTDIRYARTQVGDGVVVLLPESAEMRLEKFNGEISDNRMDFTHCRVFGAETKLSFEAPDTVEGPARFGASSVDDTLRPLAAGLQITVNLRGRITGDMAVGTLIDGVVAGNVTAKGRAVVIPAGSAVHGRIRRLERYTEPFPYYVVALEFTEVEVEGIRYRFWAEPVEVEPIAGIEQKLWTKESYMSGRMTDGGSFSQQQRENLILPELPGVASFFFHAAKLDLPVGFRTVWKTRALER